MSKSKSCIFTPVVSWDTRCEIKRHARLPARVIDELGSSFSTLSSITVSSCGNDTCGNDTFLPHLELGDIGTSKDMMIVSNRSAAFEMANFLQTHDFAFILRSNGRWTYAIVANRGQLGTSSEDTLLFVVDSEGSVKKLPRKYWSTCIRIVKNAENYSRLVEILRSTTNQRKNTICFSMGAFMDTEIIRKKHMLNLTRSVNSQKPSSALMPGHRNAPHCGRPPLPPPPFKVHKRRL